MPSGSTIFALSTPPGRSGIAVIRVSGPLAHEGLKILAAKAKIIKAPQLLTLRDPVSRETLDHALVLVFQTPKSFTGEDCVEYHLHGGRAVVQSILEALSSLTGHRMAEPGEFTRRAFENGKIDLTAAEAIADLIDAETQIQKTQALAQMGGALSVLYTSWTDRLKNMLAHIEAELEFPDEDMPGDIIQTMAPKVQSLIDEIKGHLNDNRRGERLRDGLRVVIIGAPNTGKSSLLNTLAQRDVAIVSDIAGTTRDVIEVHLDLGGYPFVISDTAGLRNAENIIEAEGINRAHQRAQNADIKILMFDASLGVFDQETLKLLDPDSIVVLNKIDMKRAKTKPLSQAQIEISVKTGQGLEEFLEVLIKKAENLIGRSEAPSLTRQRHRRALENANSSLKNALNAKLPELMAEDCRLALRDLGRITGKIDVEDLLDVIFKDFCIGK